MPSLVIWIRAFTEDLNYFFRKVARKIIRGIADIILHDLDLMGQIESAKSSVAFERRVFRDVPEFKTRKALFEWALDQVEVQDGLYLEFGVYKGDSLNRLASLRPNKIFYGFDSFEGLPETWTLGSRRGSFNVEGRFPPVRKNVRLIKGFFENTLGGFIQNHNKELVSFVHVDCDLYSATRTIFQHIRPMLRPGTVIVFDEYFNYSEWEEGEFKAFSEFLQEKKVNFKYIGYIRTGSQVAVKIC